MQTIKAPLPIDNTPALNDLRRAAAKIGTPGSEEEHGAEPIEKRALGAMIEPGVLRRTGPWAHVSRGD